MTIEKAIRTQLTPSTQWWRPISREETEKRMARYRAQWLAAGCYKSRYRARQRTEERKFEQ